MGNPHYEVIGGSVEFQGQNLLDLSVNERAKAGIFMSFQNPLEVPGISLANFIRNALEQRTGKRIRLWDFRKEIAKALEVLNMDPSYADRDLNVGFSGGEKKKAEIFTAAHAEAESRDSRRDGFRSRRGCGENREPRH